MGRKKKSQNTFKKSKLNELDRVVVSRRANMTKNGGASTRQKIENMGAQMYAVGNLKGKYG